MGANGEAVIELIGVDVPRAEATPASVVLRDVSWTVQRGDFWVVGGSPGAGKTDLLCTAAGLQRPAAGEQRLFGKSLAAMNEADLVSSRLRLAVILDTGRLFADLTVWENVALPLRYHRDEEFDAKKVERMLAVTGLAEVRDRWPRQVTRNLHQRVALARALALGPEILLIDNPAAGLDPRQTRWWLDFLQRANGGHPEFGPPLTVVVTADDLRPWRDTARRFAVLKEKQFLAIGGREELRQSQDPLIRDLLSG